MRTGVATWPLNWQRHYRVVTDPVDTDGVLPYVVPSVVFDGGDIGSRRRQRDHGPARCAEGSARRRPYPSDLSDARRELIESVLAA